MNREEVEMVRGLEADIRALRTRVTVEREIADYWYERAMATERGL